MSIGSRFIFFILDLRAKDDPNRMIQPRKGKAADDVLLGLLLEIFTKYITRDSEKR